MARTFLYNFSTHIIDEHIFTSDRINIVISDQDVFVIYNGPGWNNIKPLQRGYFVGMLEAIRDMNPAETEDYLVKEFRNNLMKFMK